MTSEPLTRAQAFALVDELHRHHPPAAGYRYAFAIVKDGRRVGACIIGRPRARAIDQYRRAEVSRVATDGTKNACSFAYGVAGRVCRELGFDAVFTCILDTEPGTSLKAAGWVYCYTTRGESQDRPGRRRVDKSPTGPKQVWSPSWCADLVRQQNVVACAKAARKGGG